jgi:surfactin synthase thioesterase subunit
VLRADLAWLSQPWSTEPLSASVPITAAAGNRDVLIGPEVMRHWAHFGGHDFQLRTVPGGHLFHIESPAAAAGLLS